MSSYTLIAAIIISIIIGAAITISKHGNNPANDDAVVRSVRRAVHYRPQIRRSTNRRGG